MFSLLQAYDVISEHSAMIILLPVNERETLYCFITQQMRHIKKHTITMSKK